MSGDWCVPRGFTLIDHERDRQMTSRLGRFIFMILQFEDYALGGEGGRCCTLRSRRFEQRADVSTVSNLRSSSSDISMPGARKLGSGSRRCSSAGNRTMPAGLFESLPRGIAAETTLGAIEVRHHLSDLAARGQSAEELRAAGNASI
jgi:hypothetical protein